MCAPHPPRASTRATRARLRDSAYMRPERQPVSSSCLMFRDDARDARIGAGAESGLQAWPSFEQHIDELQLIQVEGDTDRLHRLPVPMLMVPVPSRRVS